MSKSKIAPAVATIAALRAKHDPKVVTRNKVTAQLALLKKRGAEYQYEQDFLREAQISPLYMRHVKAEFAKHIATVVEIGKKSSRQVWFPNPAHATAIRKEQEALKNSMSGSIE